MNTTPCPPAETLDRLLRGGLSAAEADDLRLHLAECPACQAALDRLTDDAGLRRWKTASATAPSADAPPPTLTDRALGELLARVAVTAAAPAAGPPDDLLRFLGPPAAEGHLGTLGSYQILAELGRGGMGVVLLAYDPELKRTVALKVLRPDRDDERSRARFLREARAAAGIDHEHVVRLHGVVAPDDGPPYLIMQYIAGLSLRERIGAEKRLEPREAARIVAEAADGLVAAHARGLIHRDMKPGNVLLEAETGRARVADFGLVRPRERTDDATTEGAIAGTPEYMSPEQVKHPDAVDARTDVYGLGATLYEALTGEAPFRGAMHMVLQQVLFDEPAPPRRLNDATPRDLETICLKAMAKEPGRRYPRAADLRDDLRRWLKGEPIKARPVGRVERLWRLCRRHPWTAGLTAALVLVFAAGFAGVVWQWQEARANLRRAEQERDRAEDNFQLALDVANRFSARVREEFLRNRSKTGSLHEDLETLRECYERLADRQRGDDRSQAGLADTLTALGIVRAALGQRDAAEAACNEALALNERLAQRQPDEPRWKAAVGRSHNNLAAIHEQFGQFDRAEADLDKAAPLLEQAARGRPEDADLQAEWIRTAHNAPRLRVLRSESLPAAETESRLAAAAADMRSNIEAMQRLAGANPAAVHYQRSLGQFWSFLGETDQALGRLDDAQAAHQAASGYFQRLAQADPDALHDALELAGSRVDLGNARRDAGAGEAALTDYQAAEDLLARMPQLEAVRAMLVTLRANRAIALFEMQRYGEAAAAWERMGAAPPALFQFVREYFLARSKSDAASSPKNYAQAAAELDALLQAIAAKNPLPGGTRHLAACVYAQASAAARQDAGLLPSEQEQRADQYARRAVAMLEKARVAGYFQAPGRVESIKNDPDFAALHGRDDFGALLTELGPPN